MAAGLPLSLTPFGDVLLRLPHALAVLQQSSSLGGGVCVLKCLLSLSFLTSSSQFIGWPLGAARGPASLALLCEGTGAYLLTGGQLASVSTLNRLPSHS